MGVTAERPLPRGVTTVSTRQPAAEDSANLNPLSNRPRALSDELQPAVRARHLGGVENIQGLDHLALFGVAEHALKCHMPPIIGRLGLANP